VEFKRLSAEVEAREKGILDDWEGLVGARERKASLQLALGESLRRLVEAGEEGALLATLTTQRARLGTMSARLRFKRNVRWVAEREKKGKEGEVEVIGEEGGELTGDTTTSPPESCAICKEPGLNNPAVLPCGHMFHLSPCVEFLVANTSLKCPTCREPFTTSSIYSVDTRSAGKERDITPLPLYLSKRGGGGSSSSSSSGSGSGSGSGSSSSSGFADGGVRTTAQVNACSLPESLSSYLGSKGCSLLRRLKTLPPNDKAIVVCTWGGVLPHFASACRAEGLQCAILGGSATTRADTVSSFSLPTSSLRVLFLQSETDCAGLTLTSANHLYLLDQPLSPNILTQLTARIARLGQTKPCFVYHFVSTPLDEAVMRVREGEVLPLPASSSSSSSSASTTGTTAKTSPVSSLIIDGTPVSAHSLCALLRASCTL
jgi:hypothetical protein